MALPSFLVFLLLRIRQSWNCCGSRVRESVSLSRLVAELRLAAAMDDIGQYVD